mgnify:CR=1 FL=1
MRWCWRLPLRPVPVGRGRQPDHLCGQSEIARLNRFGQVTQVYDLGTYELHHDINWGPEGTILALATDLEGETVEDQVLQIDLESGEVTHIVDFTPGVPKLF